jgi:hypothetical protein
MLVLYTQRYGDLKGLLIFAGSFFGLTVLLWLAIFIN